MKRLVLTAVLAVLGLSVAPVQAVGEKTPIVGLVHRQDVIPPVEAFRPVVNAGIITVYWKDLQGTKGGPLKTGAIDSAIAAAESYGQKVKLKVYAGRYSPTWAKNLGGSSGPSLCDPQGGDCYSMPRWWLPAFADAYDDLMAKLAAKYETNPTVTTVQASMTGLLFAEPFLRLAGDQTNVNRMVNKGFTFEKDDVAIRRMVSIHAARWPTTRTDLAVHPYQRIDAASKKYLGWDQDYTRSIMSLCRSTLGVRCQFGYTGHGKTVDPSQTHLVEMYGDLEMFGGPLWLQTATLDKLGGTCADIKEALQKGVDMGAQSVELPAGYQNVCHPEDLEPYDAALEANAVA